MRWSVLLLALLVLACGSDPKPPVEARAELRGESSLVELFREAERETGVPAPLLATVAYLETRLSTKPRAKSDGHAPPVTGIMGIGTGGLVSLESAAARAGVSPEECATDTRTNIRAAALVLAAEASGDDYGPALSAYGGEVLRATATRLLATGWKSSDDAGLSIEVAGSGAGLENIGTVQQAIGFPGSIWNPAVGYTNANRGPDQINYVVIHTTQGSYGGTISWFKNPAAQASSHYVVRSSDGEITQMVDDADIAWHDACFNSETIGIEHEGFAEDPGTWYTEAMYGASAKLTAWLCDAYGIPKDHNHIMGHGEAPDCSDHWDPGPGWNWDHYLNLVQSGGVTAQNCTPGEAQGCANYGCGCADHQCSGGFCPGTGCTPKSIADCGAFGCNCVDGQCNGGYCDGSGCTAKEANDCAAFGSGCIDHQCNGGTADGQGCTAKQTMDCGNYGCGCTDQKCNSGFCEGNGCTFKQNLVCEQAGQTCKDAKCVGGETPPATGGAAGASGGGSSGWSQNGLGGDDSDRALTLKSRENPANTDALEGSCSCRVGTRTSGAGLAWLFGLILFALVRRRPTLLLAVALLGCATKEPEAECELPADEPALATTSQALSSIDCNEYGETGYDKGNAFPITVVTVDGKPVEVATANAYYVMAQAAANDGVNIQVVSGFRTMAQQQYLYNCYITCSCNNCNLAAEPGYSNHQSGHALDLNTSAGGVYAWLDAHAGAYGFTRTVPSEAWHWEWWGGGPGGGPCGLTPENCTQGEAAGCANYGCGCVDHQCNGGFCPGTGCSAQSIANCGAFGCNCVDGKCNGGFCEGSGCTAKEANDCAAYGSGCIDHQCNGGTADGQGCTAKQTMDCGNYGCGCTDQKCNSGFCEGNGCTFKQNLVCEEQGKTCKDAKCEGGGGGEEPPPPPATGGTAGAAATGGSGGGGWAGNGLGGDDDRTPKLKDDEADAEDEGCGCRVGPRDTRDLSWQSLGLLAIGVLLARRSRRAHLSWDR
jgi:hypothetical protein